MLRAAFPFVLFVLVHYGQNELANKFVFFRTGQTPPPTNIFFYDDTFMSLSAQLDMPEVRYGCSISLPNGASETRGQEKPLEGGSLKCHRY